ncbi:protein phosphatase 1 regulatory subunit 1B-like [Denticeps clupeoides]|uniref:Protein phosphatase 1 regulatory subunit 1B n=1 Tax=Denticeps clupeoides TaxID=299321 RepID=A0AAY4ADV7_9TELE|nr:protein phosphatase 1 regulatory subunit 1B-like [Denticeps clupeoides]
MTAMHDADVPTETLLVGEDDAKERKRIHFSVPSVMPMQLDPRQVEMIRRRRPTPATLFRVSDHPSPDEENPAHQWPLGENGLLKSKRQNDMVYQPPSLTAIQRLAEVHMQNLGMSAEAGDDCPSGLESEQGKHPRDSNSEDKTSSSEQPPGSEVTTDEPKIPKTKSDRHNNAEDGEDAGEGVPIEGDETEDEPRGNE